MSGTARPWRPSCGSGPSPATVLSTTGGLAQPPERGSRGQRVRAPGSLGFERGGQGPRKDKTPPKSCPSGLPPPSPQDRDWLFLGSVVLCPVRKVVGSEGVPGRGPLTEAQPAPVGRGCVTQSGSSVSVPCPGCPPPWERGRCRPRVRLLDRASEPGLCLPPSPVRPAVPTGQGEGLSLRLPGLEILSRRWRP